MLVGHSGAGAGEQAVLELQQGRLHPLVAMRGEGGVLRNSQGRRFMFDDIPDNYKPQTASDPEEGWRYTQGDKSARRPPELPPRS